MTAKEMFEKLGYRLVEVENPITGEIYEYDIQYEKFDGCFYQQILFNNSTKLMHTSCELFNKTIDFICYTPELLQAINKQVEELGWDKED